MTNLRNANIEQLANYLKSEQVMKQDIVVPAELLRITDDSKLIAGNVSFEYNINSIAHEQLAAKFQIPKKYYDKILESPGDIYRNNMNYWFNHTDKNYLLRTFREDAHSGLLRAFLSDSYNMIDNYDLLITALDVIKDYPNIKIQSADLTQKKMYVSFYDPSINIDAPDLLKGYKNTGNGNYGIISGFSISNSETGHGSYSISPRGIIKVCNNGLTRKGDILRRVHLGSQLDEGIVRWSKATERKNMELIQSQTRDAIKTFLSEEYLSGVVKFLTQDGNKKLELPVDTLKNVSLSLGLNEEKINEVLNYFIDGASPTRFGVVNAVTYYAHETKDADEQYQLESNILEYVPIMDKFDRPFKKGETK